MMSISPLRDHVCGLTPSIHATGHRPVPTAGVLMRISTMPYWTCTLPAVDTFPEVNTLLPTTWFCAVNANSRQRLRRDSRLLRPAQQLWSCLVELSPSVRPDNTVLKQARLRLECTHRRLGIRSEKTIHGQA